MKGSKESNKNNKLHGILNRVTGKDPKKSDKILALCEVIEMCGGWQNFQETPIPVIQSMNELMNRRREEDNKMAKLGMPGRKR